MDLADPSKADHCFWYVLWGAVFLRLAYKLWSPLFNSCLAWVKYDRQSCSALEWTFADDCHSCFVFLVWGLLFLSLRPLPHTKGVSSINLFLLKPRIVFDTFSCSQNIFEREMTNSVGKCSGDPLNLLCTTSWRSSSF